MAFEIDENPDFSDIFVQATKPTKDGSWYNSERIGTTPTIGEDNTPPPPNILRTYKETYQDPTYSYPMVFVTNNAVEPPSGRARHSYSRHQAFNADNTKLLVFAGDGFWHIYDLTDNSYYSLAGRTDLIDPETGPWQPFLADDCEAQWHPTDPNIIRYTGPKGSLAIFELDLTTNNHTVWKDFTTEIKAIFPTAAHMWTKAEGSPSTDHRYWGFQVETEPAFSFLGFAIWDSVTDTLTTVSDAQIGGLGRPDHCSMSKTGNYFIPSWDGVGGPGTRAYLRSDFGVGNSFTQLHATSEHSCTGLLPNGNDFYMAVDYQTNDGDIFYTEIQTNTKHVLFGSYPGERAFHFSATCIDKPGYVVMSSYGLTATSTRNWFDEKIMVIKLDPTNPVFFNIAHTQRINETDGTLAYFAEPQASVNKNLTKIVFAANSQGQGTMDACVITLHPTDLDGV